MSDDEIKKEEQQQEQQVEETSTVEDTTPDTQEVQDVEPETKEEPVVETDEKTDETSETGNEGEEKVEDSDRGDAEAPDTEKPVEGDAKVVEEKEEEKKEEVPEESPEDVKAELEELRYSRDEENALKEIGQAQVAAQTEMQKFQAHITGILEDGLKHYGIDPEKSLEDIAKEDPAKADIARELLKAAQQHIQAKQQELIQKVGQMEQNVVFNRAEREIKKFKLTAEQEIEAAKMFVKIINTTGVADISEDLKEKVRLAVASAKMSVPVEAIIPPAETSDTTVLKEPSEKIEEKVEEKTEEKPDVAPVVDMDDYKESPTDTAKITQSTAPEVNEENVLAKMSAMPYKDRVAFMIEHQDIVDAAMKKESARRERERRKI